MTPPQRSDVPSAPAGRPLFDLRLRWKAGQVALGLAGVLTLAALFRPLAPGASPRLRLVLALALGLGVVGSGLLASLKHRGRAEQLALYAFLVLSLDGLGQMLIPLGWPIWPLLALLVAAASVAESQGVALGVAALAFLLTVADAATTSFAAWRPAVAAGLGYAALVLAIHHALKLEKQRLASGLAELARLKLGIDQLAEAEGPPGAGAPAALQQVSEEGRRARQVDRAQELDTALLRIVKVARAALSAHAVVYFDVDRERETAHLRAGDGPESLLKDSAVPLTSDPFAFVLERRQAFYATDFKRLLWSLPYYRGEVKVGSLLAVPVRTAEVVSGVLLADRLEIQAFAGDQPALLESFAELAGDAILATRASLGREELGQEFKAAYEVSKRLAAMENAGPVRNLLLKSARDLVPFEAGAVVMKDSRDTRYTISASVAGWAKEFKGREVGLVERTWTAWVLRSSEEAFLLDHLAGHQDRMPVLVLDEGSGRAESLLAVPLRARNRTLGALILLGRRGTFAASTARVLGTLANQAAATLCVIQTKERHKELAVRDGLTGLYNRREFNRLLEQAIAREERQKGRFALLLLDIDHFKKLNDTFGHPAGDAALKSTAHAFEGRLRKGDQAARFGGEEFVAILPGADEAGALHLADRIRSAVQQSELVFEGARLSVTISLGAAVWPQDGQDEETLLASADRALYAAKQAGRNRVVAASTLPPLSPAAAE